MSAPLSIAPLGCLSPDLVQNTPRFGQVNVPQSPSHQNLGSSPPKHARQNSDVQGMVARFNSLDIKDHAELRKRDEAALRRAQMGREEAESELKKQKEETRRLKREQDEAKERERKVVKRIDVLMEELHRAKEAHQHAQIVFEKEIRRARKEAFKSSSAVVKMQEELKSTRNQNKVIQLDLSTERLKAQRKDQDIFEAQCKAIALQDNLTQALAQIKVVEEERDALKMNLKKEEVMQIAAQGHIALPQSPEEDLDEFSSPKLKLRHFPLGHQQQGHSNSTGLKEQLEDLRLQLKVESQNRALAQEQVDFMKLECQFGCCSCRIAESQQVDPAYDQDPGEEEKHTSTSAPSLNEPAAQALTDKSAQEVEFSWSKSSPSQNVADVCETARPEKNDSLKPDCGTAAAFVRKSEGEQTCSIAYQALHRTDPTTAQFKECGGAIEGVPISSETDQFIDTNVRIPSSISNPDGDGDDDDKLGRETARAEEAEATSVHSSQTSIRTVTHTTTIPLVDESTPGFSAFFAPGSTLSREEALERIRERRGRARSVTGTPKRTASVARTPRRDISAPEHCKTSKIAGKISGSGR